MLVDCSVVFDKILGHKLLHGLMQLKSVPLVGTMLPVFEAFSYPPLGKLSVLWGKSLGVVVMVNVLFTKYVTRFFPMQQELCVFGRKGDSLLALSCFHCPV